MKLYTRIKSFLESMSSPRKLENVRVEVFNSTCLKVSFSDPAKNTTILNKFRCIVLFFLSFIFSQNFKLYFIVEWSSNSSFETLDGWAVVSALNRKRHFLIKNLITSKVYFIRASCSNLKGFGPYAHSLPSFAIPSCNLLN